MERLGFFNWKREQTKLTSNEAGGGKVAINDPMVIVNQSELGIPGTCVRAYTHTSKLY